MCFGTTYHTVFSFSIIKLQTPETSDNLLRKKPTPKHLTKPVSFVRLTGYPALGVGDAWTRLGSYVAKVL